MRTPTYPSDLTDEQWALVEPLIPVYPGGRPRTTPLRDVLDAILYVLRTGCQWRYLPKDFPPRSTVWGYFDEWRHNGTLERIHDTLREAVRAQERPSPRTTASIDSQSVPTTEGGEQTGRDNGKKVNGRKRHILVDSLGLLLAVVVTAANVDDGAAAPQVLARMEGQPVEQVERVFADSKYHNHGLYLWVADNTDVEIQVLRRPEGAQGWVQLPIRWTVERTFAWLKRCRRLTVDREKSTRSARAMIHLAMIHLMLNRWDPNKNQPEFQYRNVA